MITPGQVIGNYRIIEKIGAGGMGEVFKADDLVLEREVAIKVLKQDLEEQVDLIERFRKEAVILGKLHHQNIAALYGFLGRYKPFCMVMEFAPGESLVGVLKRYPKGMPLPLAMDLFDQVLAALEHAHHKDIIHRDIKPANIMVDEDRQVKVMDFGIARVLGSQHLTRIGFIVGTPKYMSPEQVHSTETDARSDVYSLGIVCYEMLTGSAPFDAHSEFEILRAHVELPPRPLSTLVQDIPKSIEAVIMRALAKSPEARYRDAGEFRHALHSALQLTAYRKSSADTDDIFDTLSGVDHEHRGETGTAEPTIRESEGFIDHASALNSRTNLPSYARRIPSSGLPKISKYKFAWLLAVPIGIVLIIAGIFPLVGDTNLPRLKGLITDFLEKTTIGNEPGPKHGMGQAPREEDKQEAEEDARQKAAAEALRKAEEDAQQKAAAEAQRKAEEDARQKAAAEAQRKAEEDARQKAAAEAQRKAEEDARQKAAAEAQRKAEEDARQKAVAEAQRKAEEDARQKAAAEAQRKAEEETRQKATTETKRKAEEESRQKAEAAAQRKTKEELRRKALAEAKRKAQEEARQNAESQSRRRAEAEARERKAAEAEREALEIERRNAAAEAQRRAESEARERALAESKRKAREEARQQAATAEAQRKADEAARQKAKEEAKRKAQEKARQRPDFIAPAF